MSNFAFTKRGSGDCGSSPQAHGKVTISVKSGYDEERIVELELGGRMTTVLEVFAAERGCLVDELVLDPRRGRRSAKVHPRGRREITLDKCRHHVHHIGEVNSDGQLSGGPIQACVQAV